MESCVYGHYIDDELIYIGKGTDSRANRLDKHSRNSTWQDLSAGKDVEVRILFSFNSEAEALDKEGDLIRRLLPVANRFIPKMKVEVACVEKIAHEYAKVSLPLQVAQHVDAIYKARESAGNKCRKADIWIEMANKVKK